MNRRAALGVAKTLGCNVKPIRRTGELRVSHPDLPAPLRISGHRRDANRILTVALRQLAQRSQVLNQMK